MVSGEEGIGGAVAAFPFPEKHRRHRIHEKILRNNVTGSPGKFILHSTLLIGKNTLYSKLGN
jgi:hypothetical protein